MSLLLESYVDFEQVQLSSVVRSLTAGSITSGALNVSGASTLTGVNTLDGANVLNGRVIYGNALATASITTLLIESEADLNLQFPGFVLSASPSITFGVISSGIIGQQLSVYAPNITASALSNTNFTVTGIVNGGASNSSNAPRFVPATLATITGLSAQLLCITSEGQFRWMLV